MRKRRRELAQSGDIAFLLIIFFILLTGLPTLSRMDVTVNQQEQLSGSSQNATYQILLTSTGELYLEKIALDYPTQLKGRLASFGDVVLSIEADTSWHYVVDLLENLQSFELSSLTMREIDK
ncbi:MAG: biopolymer transporter ExbD [Sphaerochaetaceae bacterium]|jgi:biopolymer transport protein ExbD